MSHSSRTFCSPFPRPSAFAAPPPPPPAAPPPHLELVTLTPLPLEGAAKGDDLLLKRTAAPSRLRGACTAASARRTASAAASACSLPAAQPPAELAPLTIREVAKRSPGVASHGNSARARPSAATPLALGVFVAGGVGGHATTSTPLIEEFDGHDLTGRHAWSAERAECGAGAASHVLRAPPSRRAEHAHRRPLSLSLGLREAERTCERVARAWRRANSFSLSSNISYDAVVERERSSVTRGAGGSAAVSVRPTSGRGRAGCEKTCNDPVINSGPPNYSFAIRWRKKQKTDTFFGVGDISTRGPTRTIRSHSSTTMRRRSSWARR